MSSSDTTDNRHLLSPSETVTFADVAHQTLIFNLSDESSRLVLELIDTRWVQRLRNVRQTGNTQLVYMFAEHSRFGHSLGVAYLALLLMSHLKKTSKSAVEPWENAVAAAALLHDIGHVAPGSHLAERVWSRGTPGEHEGISARIIAEDPEIREILARYDGGLAKKVIQILDCSEETPPWARDIISGGGWNADRGNWAIVDSAMCSVSYGRYNVLALIDAFRLSPDGRLVLLESRLDALTHFFVARDSMYRQVYQHRVLQTTDAMTINVVVRIRDLLSELGAADDAEKALDKLGARGIFGDRAMAEALTVPNYGQSLGLDVLFSMTESWWRYHLERWCSCSDAVLADLAQRLRDRKLLKTVRIGGGSEDTELLKKAAALSLELGFEPRYYVTAIENADRHRGKNEEMPSVLMDNEQIVPASQIEPLIAEILERRNNPRTWLAVPKEVKDKLGRFR